MIRVSVAPVRVARMATCSAPGCSRSDLAQRTPPLCKPHYYQMRNRGYLGPLKVARVGCQVDGCERAHRAKGYCHRHYEQIIRLGITHEIGARRGVSPRAICREPGCGAKTYFQYCPEHTPSDRICAARGCEHATRSIACIYCATHAQRDANLRHSYNISLRQKEALVADRDGRCDICHRQADLHLDHDHGTKAIRGFLCGPCNRALGLLGDDPKRVSAAVRYLEVHRV